MISEGILSFKPNTSRKLIRSVSAMIILVAIHFPFSSSPETGESGTREQLSARYKLIPNQSVSWSTLDLLMWQMSDSDGHLLQKKKDFIEGNANIIVAAAAEYHIPAVLLAGVSWREFGGDPQWIDNVAFMIRKIDHSTDSFSQTLSMTRPALETSFGNVSIQVRRAAVTLGYNPETLSDQEVQTIIDALEDPVYNFFIAAHHLSDLLEIDFPEKNKAELTNDELKITATRFYRGSELSLAEIKKDTRYGDNVLKRFELLNILLTGK